MNLLKAIKAWWNSKREEIRANTKSQYLANVQSDIQLTVSNGKAYISHQGQGIRQLDPNLTLAAAIQILQTMRDNAKDFANEENII